MTASTTQLATLIRHKHRLLARLVELGQRQLAVIDAGDMAALMELLTAKSQLLDAVRRLERGIDPFRHEDPDRRTWETAGLRDECRQLHEECTALLTQLVQLERHSETSLARRRDEAAERLSGMHAAAFACEGYANPHPTMNTFDDASDVDGPARGARPSTNPLGVLTTSAST